MDPEYNWQEQLRLARKIRNGIAAVNHDLLANDAYRLAELADSLLTWTMRGGFKPKGYRRLDTDDRAYVRVILDALDRDEGDGTWEEMIDDDAALALCSAILGAE